MVDQGARKVRLESKRSIKKPRGEYHHGDLRRAVVQATLQILGEADRAEFTLREAARRIGVNHRAVYRHFADREAVLATVAEEGYHALVQAARAALADLPPAPARPRLLAIAQSLLSFAMREPARYLVMTGPRLNEDGRFPELEAPISEGFALITSELSAGIARGELEELELTVATLTLFAAAHGLATMLITRRIQVAPAALREFTEQSLGHLVRGFERVRS
jgi:AcrR family transcriptional regulator